MQISYKLLVQRREKNAQLITSHQEAFIHMVILYKLSHANFLSNLPKVIILLIQFFQIIKSNNLILRVANNTAFLLKEFAIYL